MPPPTTYGLWMGCRLAEESEKKYWTADMAPKQKSKETRIIKGGILDAYGLACQGKANGRLRLREHVKERMRLMRKVLHSEV